MHLPAVRSAQKALPLAADLEHLSALLSAPSDPTHLRIVAAMNALELCVCDITAVIGLSESAVSHQLRQLEGLGLVRCRREGRIVIYSLDNQHVSTFFGPAREHVANAGERDAK